MLAGPRCSCMHVAELVSHLCMVVVHRAGHAVHDNVIKPGGGGADRRSDSGAVNINALKQ